ncbi:crustapain-like [Haematobia irritans]|uniref:crustapain-like n=1 Tax=Haematobia irritans TaxID=7368 RepID=UPI003F4FC01C
MSRLSIILVSLVFLVIIDYGSSTSVSDTEWLKYVDLYKKTYPDKTAENNARYYYAYNKNMIDTHNVKYEKGQKTFKLAVNQFTDMRLIHFNALFPVTTPLPVSHASIPPTVAPGSTRYNPMIDMGYKYNIEDQGTKCNSGWAYAAVKAIEILKAKDTGISNPATLSAQNMIDCAGSSRACIDQVPQTAYDYLTQYQMNVHEVGDYPNNKESIEPFMCLARGTLTTKLVHYSVLNDDEILKNYVYAGFPVVIEVNPASFEFMHYSEGIYQPPSTTTKGSHYMTVIGYEADYWIVQNSFGPHWGENGLMRIQKSSTIKIANNAIFPTEWA